tara:strand:- start:196 stop:420 length:225 start_codon:yes stop_codon:yes gene_type:complete
MPDSLSVMLALAFVFTIRQCINQRGVPIIINEMPIAALSGGAPVKLSPKIPSRIKVEVWTTPKAIINIEIIVNV